MATFYPTTGSPREIKPTQGRQFTEQEVKDLLGGEVFYNSRMLGKDAQWSSRYAAIVICIEHAYTLGLPLNPHRQEFLVVSYGDVLVVTRDELDYVPDEIIGAIRDDS